MSIASSDYLYAEGGLESRQVAFEIKEIKDLEKPF